MNSDLQLRIMGQNKASPALQEVGRDIKLMGDRAQIAGGQVNRMGNTIGRSSRMAAYQTRNLVYQLNDIGVSLISGMNPMIVAAQQGSQISTIYGPGEGGLGRAFKETGKLAVGMVTKFWPVALAIGAGAAALAGMTYEINRMAKASLNMGDVARATWQVFADSIANITRPAIEAVSPWVASLWNTIVSITKQGTNLFIGAFVWAFKAIKAVWEHFPTVIDDVIISAVNNMIGGVQNMINAAIWGINQFTALVNKIPGVNIGDLGTIDMSGLQLQTKGAWDDYAKAAREAMVSSLTTDYAGNAFDAIMKRALANITAATDAANGLGSALKGAGDKAIDLMKGISTAGAKTLDWAKTLTGAFKGIGSELMKIITGTGTFGDKAIGVFNAIIDRVGALGNKLIDMALDKMISGLLANLVGAFAGGFGGVNFGTPGTFKIGNMWQYASGGYTGGGALDQAAGIVHGQEYVMNAAATRQIGVSNLDAMNSGRAPVANFNNARAANGNGDRAIIINNSITINTPDIGSFRQSEQQIAARLVQMTRRGVRNL